MNDYRYRVTLRTAEGHEIRISLFDDYYEAVEAAIERALEYRDICSPEQTTVDDMLGDSLITSQKFFTISEKDKLLATVLNLLYKAQIDDNLELALAYLLLIDIWNKRANESSRISYRIVHTDYKVILVVEGCHIAFSEV